MRAKSRSRDSASTELDRPVEERLVFNDEEEPVAPVPVVPSEQRPNAIGYVGGPYLLRGLMLPLPPSKNGYWRSMPMVRNGTNFPLVFRNYRELVSKLRATTFPSDDAKRYKELVREQAFDRKFVFHAASDLRVSIVVCPRDRRVIDAHNYHMGVLDALQDCGVYEDDAQIKSLTVDLGPILPKGRVLFSMWEIKHDVQAAFDREWRRT
jgi:Holliday junction resolvase RusA-like endonuclease